MSKPVLTSVGYHIIYMKDRKQPEPYDISITSDALLVDDALRVVLVV